MDSTTGPGRGRRRVRRAGQRRTPAPHAAPPVPVRRSPISLALTLACSLAAGPVTAAGLGPIELASGLNERLDATIPLYNLPDHPPGAIEVGLASPERFRAADLARPHALTALRFDVEPGASGGGHVIRVRSPGAIVEPFLSFLVAVDLPEGRLVRAYTVLLDPPAFRPGTATTPVAAQPAVEAGAAAPADDGTAPEPAPAAGTDRYGPVPRGGSAWKVAEAVGPEGVSIYQTMVALRRANPAAFEGGDLGRLRQGVWLDVPGRAEILAIPRARAIGIYRQYLAAAKAPAGNGPDGATGAVAEPEPAAEAAAPPADLPVRGLAADGVGLQPNDGEGAAGPVAAAGAATGATALATGPRLERLRAEIAGLQVTIAGLREQVENGLDSRDQGAERMRESLAEVRAELAALRSRPRAAAGGGVPLWAAGLVALLAAGLGAAGGFARARRRDAGTAAAAAQPAGSVTGSERPTPMEAGADTVREDPEGDATAVDGAAEPAADVAAAAPGPAAAPESAAEPEPAFEPEADAGDWIDPEGVIVADEDSYQSLADLCLEAGWARDAEGVLRDAIEQRGDSAAYRAGILAALHHEGAAEEFLQEFERYRALAAADEPSWPGVLRMGRNLLPGHLAFATDEDAGSGGTDEPFELDDLELDELEGLDLDGTELDAPAADAAEEAAEPETAADLSMPTPEEFDTSDFGADDDAFETDSLVFTHEGEAGDGPARPEPGAPTAPASDADAGAAADEWPQLELEPEAVADEPAADAEDETPLPTLAPDAGTEAGDGDGEPDAGDFSLSLANVYLRAGWARDAEAVLREAIGRHGDRAEYRLRVLEALYQAEARDEFLQAVDDFRAVAADDDPAWADVRRMGRSLWPTHAAFAERGTGAAAPAAADESELPVEPPRRRRA